MPESCVDCDEAKKTAQGREAVTGGKDGLALKECQAIYQRWAACVSENGGTGAKQCALALKEFRECHKRMAGAALTDGR